LLLKGYYDANGHESVQEQWIVACSLLYIHGSGFPSVQGHIDRSGIVQPEKPTAVGIGIFSLSSPHAVKPTNPNQASSDCDFIPHGKICSLHSNSAERLKLKSKGNTLNSVVVLMRTQQKESLNRANTAEFLETKAKRKGCTQNESSSYKDAKPNICSRNFLTSLWGNVS
jgi:hypothetical protein